MTDGWLADPATAARFALRGEREQRDGAAVEKAVRLTDQLVTASPARSASARRDAVRDVIMAVDVPGPVICFAYQPTDVLHLASSLEQGSQWSTLVDIYEVLAELAREGRLPGVSKGGHRTAVGYLIRTRWHLYAVGFADPDPQWLGHEERTSAGDDKNAVSAAARQARLEWMEILDDLDSHPLLASQIDPTSEATLLIDLRLDASRLVGELPTAGPNRIDQDVWRHSVRNYLLPRFVLGAAWRGVWRLTGGWARGLTVVAGTLFGLALAALVAELVFTVKYGLIASAVLAGLGYLALAGATAVDRAASWPWLLRQPASAGVGLIVLASFDGDWWIGSTASQRWFAGIGAAVMLLVGVGYLAVEAANHGVVHRLRRVTAVAGAGLLHAALVAAIGLGVLLPAIAEHGDDLARCWTAGECGQESLPRWLIFAAAAGWSFAAGVFTQILWDDQPFTAPLAHLRWRRGG